MFPTVDPTLYGATLPYKDYPIQTPWTAFPWQTWQSYQKFIPPYLSQFGQVPFGQVPFGQVPFGQAPFGGMGYQGFGFPFSQQFYPQAHNVPFFGSNYNMPFFGMNRYLPY